MQQSPRHAVTRGFGITEIVTSEAFIEVFTRTDTATARLAAAQYINVKHGDDLTISGRRDSNPRPVAAATVLPLHLIKIRSVDLRCSSVPFFVYVKH
jgi:hypothetical protein